MIYIKMLIAGVAFPSIVLPCLLAISLFFGREQILTIPFLHFIPLIWGIWNIFYFTHFVYLLPQNKTLSLFITGAVLGFLIALYGVFGLHIPEMLHLPKTWTYM